MTIAAKHFDPIMGVDVHIIMIPSPAGPIPTPLPNPYVGMVMDPFDYVPFIGATVKVNGVPRAQAGTAGLALVPHLPLGGPFGPPPPSNESEVFMGSATVAFDGDAQSYLGLMVLSCQSIGMPAPPRAKGAPPKSLVLPTSVVLAIPMGMLVMIGGPPTISLMALGFRVGLAGLKKLAELGPIARRIKGASDAIHEAAEKAMKKLGLGDGARNAVHKGICAVTGHPVDIATGKVFTDALDFALPGPIPFSWERTWYSTSTYQGPLGHGWHHTYDQKLLVEGDVILLQTAEGRHVGFPHLKPGAEYFDRREKLTLFRDGIGYAIRDREGLVHRFVTVAGRSTDDLPLAEIRDPAGNCLQFRYDAWGRLAQIVDCAGRCIDIASDQAGRIVALIAPHPRDTAQRLYVASYAYDSWGNLTEVRDALGKVTRFTYQGHLLVRETNRNGFSFYFQYDGAVETARCIRTWGDGGIYDHKLTYDTELDLTVVEDSLGHRTLHEHRDGLVVRKVDPLGHVSLVEYSEYNEVLSRTDALGRKEAHSYDERGNRTKLEYPDGSALTFTYAGDLLVQATTELGGTFTFSYDDRRRLLKRQDPTGASVEYRYDDRRLIAIRDERGLTTAIFYDDQGSPSMLRTETGWKATWSYDLWGRSVSLTGPKGNVESRDFDDGNRVLRVHKADGTVRELGYDDENNVVYAKDSGQEVRFTYAGHGRLASRNQNGVTVWFGYDTEMRLIGVRNEVGEVYRFVLGPTGELAEEHGFDGAVRRHQRDALGRIVRTDRPEGRFTEYTYDARGRTTAVKYSDGEAESFKYRADGTMATATNRSATVAFEYDALGRIAKESQGQHWVASTYDPAGERVRLCSSLGLELTTTRDALGQPVHMQEGRGFTAAFRRDETGAELERSLPGGVTSRWTRDSFGRPQEHQISVNGGLFRAFSYQWGPDRTLQLVVDALNGRTRYGYDALNRLAIAEYQDGSRALRVPDALGNLFRSQMRNDRVYGPSGRLLESRDERGQATRYRYDEEGNLVEKLLPSGRTWRYGWSAAGRLAEVMRPDGTLVRFTYDALGRRVSKSYRGQTTRWVWDGTRPLHEWVEGQLLPVEEPDQGAVVGEDDATLKQRDVELSKLLARGPPDRGTRSAPITWLFEPESFSPMAKLTGDRFASVVTDHLGAPIALYDAHGVEQWSGSLDAYGHCVVTQGERADVPFRFPGQYEDPETGLYYNYFRYYDPDAGLYVSPDPLGLEAGNALYAYVQSPFSEVDTLGLSVADALARAMGKADRAPGNGQTAHHIVQRNGGPWADQSEALLQRHNSRWTRDSASNGASLWGTQSSQIANSPFADRAAARASGAYHAGTHLHGDAAQERIFRILQRAERMGMDPEKVLQQMGRKMEAGKWC